MIVVSYYNHARDGKQTQVGMLAWRVESGVPHAIGGIDIPPRLTERERENCNPITVVSTDGYCRSLPGWVRPDKIEEISGHEDGMYYTLFIDHASQHVWVAKHDVREPPQSGCRSGQPYGYDFDMAYTCRQHWLDTGYTLGPP